MGTRLKWIVESVPAMTQVTARNTQQPQSTETVHLLNSGSIAQEQVCILTPSTAEDGGAADPVMIMLQNITFARIPMMYDLRYKGCNYDYLTDCGSRPVCDECNDNCGASNPQTTSEPTDTPCGHEFDCHGKPNGNYTDPYSCERFIVCEGGYAFPEYCPPGLFYDPVLNQCGWEWEVPCGSRPPCDECMGEC